MLPFSPVFTQVMQIFICIVVGIPVPRPFLQETVSAELLLATCEPSMIEVMRTPLQILFLILVTDLPPSIALGMEPGAWDITFAGSESR